MLLCVGASAGGHTTELEALLEYTETWPVEPCRCVTTMEMLRERFETIAPTTVIGESNRQRPLSAFGVCWRAFRFAQRERPDVLVTTGSFPLVLVGFWVKVFGGAVVWIDSVSQMTTMSMSGRFARLFADLTLVQWESVARDDDRVEYAGQLL